MLCNNPEVWILSEDNWFMQMGLSECAVSWIDSMALGVLTVAVFVAIKFAAKLIIGACST